MSQYLLLTLGGLLFGAMVYRYDMHEREPWWMLLLAVAGGALLMAGAFFVEESLLIAAYNHDPGRDYLLLHALLAGTIEESAKLLVVVAALVLVRRHFNDPMDGLIYGSMAGLGAALFEAVWYQVHDYQTAAAPLAQTAGTNAVRFLMHTIWGGSGGFALGLIVMKRPWRLSLMQSMGCVMALHAGWDYFVGFVEEQGNLQRLIAAVLLGTSVVWYGGQVVKANKWSREMHAPTSKKRLVGRFVKGLITRRFGR
ncbi:MAG: PrsW family glutamic-type intramembrane protease [Planctomycetota bacterium]